jgi:hypothetical protein
MVGFENRIAEYNRVFKKWKHRKLPFAAQKTIINDTPTSFMVPPERIELSTPPLPRVCSTTEPRRPMRIDVASIEIHSQHL